MLYISAMQGLKIRSLGFLQRAHRNGFNKKQAFSILNKIKQLMLVILLKLYYVEYSTKKKKPFVSFSPLIICLGKKEKKENP